MDHEGFPGSFPKALFSSLIVVVFSLGFCLLFFGVAFAEEKPIGKVIGISGTVEFLPGTPIPVAEAKPGEVRTVAFEKWEIIKFHQPVYPKDRFRTSRKSRLKILFEDKSLIALGPNSAFEVESYLYDHEDKLRQGVLRMANGLSMYLVNKSQKHEKSFFRIITPTANIASRGTQGYVSASALMTFVANQAGDVGTENLESNLCERLVREGKKRPEEPCDETQIVGAGEGNKIPKGELPTTATKLTKNQFNQIKNIIMGPMIMASAGGTGPGNKPLITLEEGGVNEGGTEAGGTGPGDKPQITLEGVGGGFQAGFEENFIASVEPIAELFAEINEPFNVSQVESCAP